MTSSRILPVSSCYVSVTALPLRVRNVRAWSTRTNRSYCTWPESEMGKKETVCISRLRIILYFDSIWRFHVNILALYLCFRAHYRTLIEYIRKLGENVARTQQIQKYIQQHEREKGREKKNWSHLKQSRAKVSYVYVVFLLLSGIRLYCIWNINVICWQRASSSSCHWMKVKGKVKIIFTIRFASCSGRFGLFVYLIPFYVSFGEFHVFVITNEIFTSNSLWNFSMSSKHHATSPPTTKPTNSIVRLCSNILARVQYNWLLFCNRLSSII